MIFDERMTMAAEHSVSCDAIDIVLVPNGYARVFAEADQWKTIRCTQGRIIVVKRSPQEIRFTDASLFFLD